MRPGSKLSGWMDSISSLEIGQHKNTNNPRQKKLIEERKLKYHLMQTNVLKTQKESFERNKPIDR